MKQTEYDSKSSESKKKEWLLQFYYVKRSLSLSLLYGNPGFVVLR